jgi:signal transduction histidine kinase/ligand-binding sensor domain-containing protein/CheY-like chemotaxis protein
MKRPDRQRARIALTLLGVFFFYTPTLPAGLDPQKAITQYHHDVWTTVQGLPQNTVPAIAQTRDGYIWLGSEAGLVRFDGLRFQLFDKKNTPDLKSNLINALLTDHSGNLWIGTAGGGLTRLRDGVFTTFTLRDGLPNEVVLSIYEDHTGALWVGTDGGGLASFRGGGFTAFTTRSGLPDDAVYSIVEDREGALWAGTHAGLARFRNGRFTGYTTHDGLPNDYIRSLSAARNGGVWIGTNGGGLSLLKDGRFHVYTTRNGLPSNSISALREDRSGNLWIGTYGAGLARMAAGAITSYSARNGLSYDDVFALFEDREGSLWIGTGGGGVNRLANVRFTAYDTQEGLSNDTALPVFEDREGNLWIGTNGGGVNRFRDGKFTTLTTRDGLADNLVFSVAEDRDGALWFGTRKGLSRLQHGKFTAYTRRNGLAGDIVLALYPDRHGNLWIGTRGGLSRFSQGVFHNYTTKDGMSNNLVLAIHEDQKENLWIGTGGGGLNRLKNGEFQIYDSKRGLSNDIVMCIHEDARGTLWVGTNGGGLNRLNEGRFTTYTTREGLPDDGVFQILEDDSHNFWISSNSGVSSISRQQLNDLADGKIRALSPATYGASDGMKSKECNGSFQPAGWKARDGKLWFPTMKGVVAIDPRSLGETPAPPGVLLEQVLINRHEVSPAASAIRSAPGAGELEFRYAAIGFRDPASTIFRYKLEGFDADWVEAGARRAAYYTNIPPGSYQFRVTAGNRNAVWNPTAASLAFTLEPHFYQTAWYYLMWVLAAAGAAAGVHLLRVRQLRVREKELSQRVEERTRDLRREVAERERAEKDLLKAKEAEQASRVRTEFLANVSHEIRTPINGILGTVELALEASPPLEQAECLNTVKNCANSLLAVVSDILDFSKIQAGKLRLDLTDFKLRATIGESLKIASVQANQKGLRLSCEIESDVPVVVRGDPARLRQVLLNLLGNAVKFTEHGEVALRVSCALGNNDGVALHFVVRDTGIGIAPEKQALIFEGFSQADNSISRKYGGTGLGLAIARRLVGLMGGEIWVDSEIGRGSEFHFTAHLGSALDRRVSVPDSSHSDRGSPVSPLRILLAEDNAVNQRIAVGLLRKRGHTVLVANNGSEALSLLSREVFDLVLMDVQMPEMDGFEATRLIREAEKHTGDHLPIVALTAHAVEGYEQQCLAAGMDAFLSKPLQGQRLFEAVESRTRRTAAPSDGEAHLPV